MQYNTGKVLDITKLNEEEKRKAFKSFSEGSAELEELLNKCNQKWIDTIGCCVGHGKSDDRAYIMFEIFRNNLYDVNKALLLFETIPDFEMDLYTHSQRRFCRLSCSPKYANTMFKQFSILIDTLLTMTEEEFEVEHIYNMILGINRYNRDVCVIIDKKLRQSSEYYLIINNNPTMINPDGIEFDTERFNETLWNGDMPFPAQGRCTLENIIDIEQTLKQTLMDRGVNYGH